MLSPDAVRFLVLVTPLLLSGPGLSQGLGTNYCTAAVNSTGAGAVMDASGSADIDLNNLVLHATGLPPDQFGIFFYGPEPAQLPFGDGFRCVGAGGIGLFRIQPPVSTGTGVMSQGVDYTNPPTSAGQISPGSTWFFQAWYRDPVAGGATFNLSDGYEISFQAGSGSGVYDGMALVPSGSFEMGWHVGSGNPDELPIHTVNLDTFYMDALEVTYEAFVLYLNDALEQGEVTVSSNVIYQVGGAGQVLCDTSGSSPAWSHLDWDGTTFSVQPGWEGHPIARVSWYGACVFANGKSRDKGLAACYDELTWSCDFSANGYRLPTEAEWEYAARGGEHTPYFRYPWGDAIDGSQANYQGSGDSHEGGIPETTPVGYYDGNQTPVGVDMANGYGLYDTSGNVWEWCWDWHDSDYYATSPSDNPTGPPTGTGRVIRGGSWDYDTAGLRSANRGENGPFTRTRNVGFRVVAAHP